MNKIVKKRLLLSKLNDCQIIQQKNVNNVQINLEKLASLNEIKSFKFKKLESYNFDGQNIEENVTDKANKQVEGYLKLVKSFKQLPKMPTSFNFSPGWSR